MKNASNETMIQASDAIVSGSTIKQVQKDFNLNYSQLWLFHTDRFMAEADRIDSTKAGYAEAIAHARGFVREGAGWRRNHALVEQSWGLLAVRCRLPESRVRRDFERLVNVDSQGLRMGKGGRFLADDATWYRGDRPDEARRAKAGTDWVKGQALKTEATAKAEDAAAKAHAAKIAKLRAKAASTTFAEEAASFNAKADAMEAEGPKVRVTRKPKAAKAS